MNQFKLKAKRLLTCFVSLLTFSAFICSIGFGIPDSLNFDRYVKISANKSSAGATLSTVSEEADGLAQEFQMVPTPHVFSAILTPILTADRGGWQAIEKKIATKLPLFIQLRILRV